MAAIEVKGDVILSDLLELHWAQWIAVGIARAYCEQRGLPFRITSIKSDRPPGTGVTKTHDEWRALDVRSSGWPEGEIPIFIAFMNKTLKGLAAFSGKTFAPTFVIHHAAPGGGVHFHFQCRKGLTLKDVQALFK
jgi:hypothetical protein